MTSQLTPNEINLLLELRKGLSNKQIAINKHVALQTVKNELSSLFVKIGANNRAQAAVIAERMVVNVIK